MYKLYIIILYIIAYIITVCLFIYYMLMSLW